MRKINNPFKMVDAIERTYASTITPAWQPRYTAMFSMADAFERACPAPASEKSLSSDTTVWFTMSDAFERAYASSVLNESEPLDAGKHLRKLGGLLRRGLTRVSRTINNVINAQAEARARDQRYSRTAW